MNWKIGQKLVCINDAWVPKFDYQPKKGDVLTFDGYSGKHDWIYTKEIFMDCGTKWAATASFFRPLIGESAKSELVSSFKEVTETSDCPMIPETETA